jgi:hypothetical protein
MVYGLDGRGSISGKGKTFSVLHSFQTGSGRTQPPIQWVPWALSPGVKRPEREADHSAPSITEVKNGVTISPLPTRLHGMVLN